MTMTSRDPAEMTGQERVQEIGAILAALIMRIAPNGHKPADLGTFERSLTGLRGRRKHSCHQTVRRDGED